MGKDLFKLGNLISLKNFGIDIYEMKLFKCGVHQLTSGFNILIYWMVKNRRFLTKHVALPKANSPT